MSLCADRVCVKNDGPRSNRPKKIPQKSVKIGFYTFLSESYTVCRTDMIQNSGIVCYDSSFLKERRFPKYWGISVKNPYIRTCAPMKQLCVKLQGPQSNRLWQIPQKLKMSPMSLLHSHTHTHANSSGPIRCILNKTYTETCGLANRSWTRARLVAITVSEKIK